MSSTKAIVMVAIDFGTTFSGFAFALKDEPSKVYELHAWPGTTGTYCKTKTELYYSEDKSGELVLRSWGAEALTDYLQAPKSSGKLIKNFKLHLAGNQYKELTAEELPGTLTRDIVITDYLREISQHCMRYLQETCGSELSIQDVQWALTVPAIWDDSAKQLMKSYAEAAGMLQTRNRNGSVNVGSPHPLGIILEPEAAAVFCLTEISALTLAKGDKFLTADLGGGTVDIVVHEKIGFASSDKMNLEMREVAKSSGGLCGATYVDKRFIQHLMDRIPCFASFVEENCDILVHILEWWDGSKRNFNGTLPQRWLVPSNLADAWRLDDQKAGRSAQKSYGNMEFTKEDLIRIFEPVVKEVIEHIEKALRPFAPGEVKTIMAVGGFTNNIYLRKRLKETFKPPLVKEIVFPLNPGGAICSGAVKLGIANEDLITSRVSRKTYGVRMSRDWEAGDPIEFKYETDDGVLKCKNCFEIFVSEGEEVPSAHSVARTFNPCAHNQESLSFSIYSCDQTKNPKYITDAGMVKEGEIEIDISSAMHLDKDRDVAVTMYFGRSSIEVAAKGVNFEASGGAGKEIPVAFKGKASPMP